MKLSTAMHDQMLPLAVAIVAALGVVMLGMGQRDLRLAAVALLAIGASLVLTDLKGWLRLNRVVANLAALSAVAISVSDFMRFDRDTQLLAVANLLIYLQIVLLFQEKLPRVYWQILVLSLLEVVIGAALNLGALFGVLLVLYMFTMLVALMLLFARREALESAAAEGLAFAKGASSFADRQRLARSEIAVITACGGRGLRFRASALVREVASASLITLLVTAVVFFSVPRFGNTMWQATTLAYQPSVGFSGTVTLGTLGAVADNPELVMRVEFRRENKPAQPYVVLSDPLFRGSILTHYSRGKWQYFSTRRSGDLRTLQPKPAPTAGVIQKIVLEPLDESVLFAVYPLYLPPSRLAAANVLYDPVLQQYVRGERAQNSQFHFEALTTGFHEGLQRPITPEPDRLGRTGRLQLLQLPSANRAPQTQRGVDVNRPRRNDAPELDELTETVAAAQRQMDRAGLSRDDPYFAFNAARALELYLRSPPFRYSLQPQPRDPALDPVEDFVKNNPQGHCEYFASALALMLRSQGIPSRVVVGFKGGDFNPVGDFFQVRQLHAHAWVEAYLTADEIPPDMRPPGFPAETAGWLTLDPTPTGDEGGTFARGGLLNALADLGDYLKHIWSNYVVGLNAERQRDAIYRPLAEMAGNVEQLVEGGEGIHVVVWRWVLANGLTFRGVFVLVAGAAVSVFSGRRIVALVAAVHKDWQRRRRSGKRHERVEFYERLEEILGRYGLRRARQQTPLEFALAAGAEMVSMTATRPHATLPRRIVEAYYRVRFGRQALDAREAESVEQQLVRLAEVLRANKRNTFNAQATRLT